MRILTDDYSKQETNGKTKLSKPRLAIQLLTLNLLTLGVKSAIYLFRVELSSIFLTAFSVFDS